MAKTRKAVEPPSEEQLVQYRSLDSLRLEAQRLADGYEREQEPLKEKFKAYVLAVGGKDRTTTRLGFVLRLQSMGANVAWKTLYIALAGAEAAAKALAKAAHKYKLVVEPVASAEPVNAEP